MQAGPDERCIAAVASSHTVTLVMPPECCVHKSLIITSHEGVTHEQSLTSAAFLERQQHGS